MNRRGVLAGLAALPFAGPPFTGPPFAGLGLVGRARAAAPPAILAGGPPESGMDRWARALALSMGAAFPGQPLIAATPVGGLDGVTAANRLDALVVPDGGTAALLPGAALLAWLIGDTRVHYDPAHWAPVLAGTTSCVLGLRNGAALPAGPASAAPARAVLRPPLRVAADRPTDIATILACARLDIDLHQVPGLGDEQSRLAAFAAGDLDLVLLGGEGVPADTGVLTASGGYLAASFGQLDPRGHVVRDPLFPHLPTVDELARPDTDFAAPWRAAAAAARLDMLLVLPRLIDPGQVALWRAAGQGAIASPALAAAADASAVTLQAASGTETIFAALGAAPLDQPSLRALLYRKYGWQPA